MSTNRTNIQIIKYSGPNLHYRHSVLKTCIVVVSTYTVKLNISLQFYLEVQQRDKGNDISATAQYIGACVLTARL